MVSSASAAAVSERGERERRRGKGLLCPFVVRAATAVSSVDLVGEIGVDVSFGLSSRRRRSTCHRWKASPIHQVCTKLEHTQNRTKLSFNQTLAVAWTLDTTYSDSHTQRQPKELLGPRLTIACVPRAACPDSSRRSNRQPNTTVLGDV